MSHGAKGWSEPAVALLVVYFCSYPPLNRLSWRRSVLIILEEISPERRDVSRRKKERKKKCRFVHWPGIELEILSSFPVGRNGIS